MTFRLSPQCGRNAGVLKLGSLTPNGIFSSPERELIVYEGIRRPSVRRASVRLSTFSNDFSSEAVRLILFIFHIKHL